MNETWWVAQEQLNEAQATILALSLDKSYLVLGPPGSGKTNLLLLRANYAYLAGQQAISIVVFTRTLQEFLRAGANQLRK
jgi:superfamily I DNA/RNA helicase